MASEVMRPWEKMAVALMVMSWAFVVPMQHYWPSIEGRLWPVVSPVSLSNPRPDPPPAYRYLWSGDAEKLRDCDFVRMEWFLGRSGSAAVGVLSEFLDPPEIRGVGGLHWEGIAISLDETSVTENSHAYVYHDCGAPWHVRSLFYDSNLSL